MRNDNFHKELEMAIQKMGYGIASFSIQVHAGEVATVLGQNFRQRRYPKGQTSIAVAYILAEIKKLCDNHKSGSLSLTLTLEEGHIKKTEIQESLSRKYDLLDKPLK